MFIPDQARVNLRFMFVHVQSRAPNLATFQRSDERVFVDNGAAGGVYENDAVSHFRKLGVRDETPRAGVKGEVHAYDIGGLEQLFKTHIFGSDKILLFGQTRAVMVLDVQAEWLGAPCYRCANPAHSQYSQRLALGLVCQAHVPPPLARSYGAVGYVNAAKRAENEEDGCIGAAGVDGARGVGDGDTSCYAGGGVDGVIACAVVGDEFEAGREEVDEFLVEAACDLREGFG